MNTFDIQQILVRPAKAWRGKRQYSERVADSLVEDSADLPLGAVVIFGAPEAGKTSLAASASAYFPKDLEAHLAAVRKAREAGNPLPLINLQDMLWEQYDDGATEALKDLGLTAPTIRWSKAFDKQEPQDKPPDLTSAKSWRQTHAAILAEVRRIRPKFFVPDTMSTMNTYLETYHRERLMAMHSGNTQRMYGFIAAENMNLAGAYARLEAVGVQNIYLFHGQADTSDLIDATAKGGMEALQKAQRQTKADGEIGKADIVLKAVGKARDLYVDNVSYVFNLRCSRDEKTKKDIRALHTRKDSGILGKSRGINRLPAEIPNPHLGKIFALLKGAA